MTFTKLFEFCNAFVQSAVGLISPILDFFIMELSEYLQLIKYMVPFILRPPIDAFTAIINFVGIGDTPMISFLFGGAIIFYLAYTFIKWILDIAL